MGSNRNLAGMRVLTMSRPMRRSTTWAVGAGQSVAQAARARRQAARGHPAPARWWGANRREGCCWRWRDGGGNAGRLGGLDWPGRRRWRAGFFPVRSKNSGGSLKVLLISGARGPAGQCADAAPMNHGLLAALPCASPLSARAFGLLAQLDPSSIGARERLAAQSTLRRFAIVKLQQAAQPLGLGDGWVAKKPIPQRPG